MKTITWNGFIIKYNEEEFNSDKSAIEFVEVIYNGNEDEFKDSNIIDLTYPDYLHIGDKEYEYVGGRLYEREEEEWW